MSQSALTATLTTTLYTVPASTESIVKEVLLCNTDTVSRDVTIYMGDGTAAKNTILKELTVSAGETKFIALSTQLLTTETISGGASSASVVSCTITGVEIT
jgi:hypothetical protein